MWFRVFSLLIGLTLAHAVEGKADHPMSNAAVKVRYGDGSSLVFYGNTNTSAAARLPSEDEAKEYPIVSSTTDPYACNEIEVAKTVVPDSARQSGFILLVPRGVCNFSNKLKNAAALGAKAVITFNTAMGVNQSMNLSEEHGAKMAFDCSNGRAMVPSPITSLPVDAPACSEASTCKSKMCVPTSVIEGDKAEVCCAWDVPFTPSYEGTIPLLFVRRLDGEKMSTGITAAPYERTVIAYDVSSFLLWLIAVATITGGSILASESERRKGRKARAKEVALPTTTGGQRERAAPEEDEEETMELQLKHVVMFIATASVFLVVLYFLRKYLITIICAMYALGAAASVMGLVTLPLFYRVLPCIKTEWTLCKVIITPQDVIAIVVALAVGAFWFAIRNEPYAWPLQDFVGICLCLMFISTLRISRLKIATVLLALAFLYDIFFVFISPYIFTSSVMITVATGGPGDSAKFPAGYCERYPEDKACIPPQKLPMLLLLPKLIDWRGGYVVLGLGDIVLPGLLLALTARFDFARRVKWWRGYFFLMIMGYAAALLLANIAVVLMKQGQPALMYIVPGTLGVLLVVSYFFGDLKNLWDGPREFSSTSGYAPAPTSRSGPGENTLEDMSRLSSSSAKPVHVSL